MRVPVVVYPDVEELVVEHLRSVLRTYTDDAVSVSIGTRKPNPMPAGGVIQVRRVGGIPETVVSDVARIDVVVWHDSDAAAHDLLQIVRAVLRLLRGTTNPTVYRVDEFAGPVRFADPDSDQPRWLLTDDIVVRGQPLEPVGS